MEESFFASSGIPRPSVVPPPARHAPWLGFTGTHAAPSQVGATARSPRIEESGPGADAEVAGEPSQAGSTGVGPAIAPTVPMGPAGDLPSPVALDRSVASGPEAPAPGAASALVAPPAMRAGATGEETTPVATPPAAARPPVSVSVVMGAGGPSPAMSVGPEVTPERPAPARSPEPERARAPAAAAAALASAPATPSPERERPAPVAAPVIQVMGAAPAPRAGEATRIARVLEWVAAGEPDGPWPAAPAQETRDVVPASRVATEAPTAGQTAPPPAAAPMGAPEALRVPARHVRGVLPPMSEPVPAPQPERPPGKQVHIGTLHVTVKAPVPPPPPVAAPAPAATRPAPSHRDPWDATFVSFH